MGLFGKKEKSDDGANEVVIVIDGEETRLLLPEKGKTILQAGLKAGLDLPYSCQGGVCTTCMAKISEGTVTMDNNFALTDSDLENGLVLTCQSHPTSEKVVVNYDEV